MSTTTKPSVAKQVARLLPKMRWFRGKARRIQRIDVIDHVPFSSRDADLALVLAGVAYADGAAETYALYLREVEGKLVDGGGQPELAESLRTAFSGGQSLAGANGTVVVECAPEAQRDLTPSADPLAARPLGAEQSNTSIVFGDQYVLKLYRVVEPGACPELEMTRFLTGKGFAHSPHVHGCLVYRPEVGPETTLGVLQGFIRGATDGWTQALESVDRALRQAQPANDYEEAARLLGLRTAELHLALGSDSSDPAFAPEPFGEAGTLDLAASFTHTALKTLQLLEDRMSKLKGATRKLAQKVLDAREPILERMGSIGSTPLVSSRIRCHGDYHLGQVLRSGADFFITDFEGEVARPAAERRRKSSPFRDAAGMLRSFHYASRAPLLGLRSGSRERKSLEPAARAWCEAASEAFLRAYLAAVKDAPFLPRDLVEQERLLKAHVLEKALYEVAYELGSRPKWLWIPLEGVLESL